MPPLLEVLGPLEHGFELFDEGAEGLFRFVAYQNLAGDTKADLVMPVLNCSYRLGNPWIITNLNDLFGDNVKAGIWGQWIAKSPAETAPALESMMLEITSEIVVKKTGFGSWQMSAGNSKVVVAG